MTQDQIQQDTVHMAAEAAAHCVVIMIQTNMPLAFIELQDIKSPHEITGLVFVALNPVLAKKVLAYVKTLGKHEEFKVVEV